MKTKGAPQLLGFVSGKIGHDHRDLEHLFLKQRNTERASQNRFETRIEIANWLASGAARQIRMHHVSLDWSRPNDRHFDDHIIKTFRLHPRESRHLRAALNLKHADCVGFLHHFKGGGVIFWNVSKIERAPSLATQLKRILHHRHHPEPEQIDFHDAEIFAIVLIPLRDDAPRHRRVLQRHKRAQLVLTNNHPPGMLAKVSRQTINRLIQPNESRHARMFLRQTSLFDLRLEIERVRKIAVREQMREAIQNARRKIERLPDLARSAAAAITDYVRGHGRAVFSVAAINFLNDRFTPIAAWKIEIDIGPAFPAFVQEPFENQIVAHRIDRRDSEAITNCAVRGAAPALDHDVVLATKIDDVPDNQKI